jgi:Domain of unknown function (DUF1992)
MADESGRMTDRKPAGMSFTSWIDRQIAEAEERGAFDNLPGSGKPLPKRDEGDTAQAWLREYLRREGVSAEELLPVPLRLRKERERLADSVHLLGSEEEVRDAVAELNQRIRDWRRVPLDSPIFVRLVDEEEIVSRWREAQPIPPGLFTAGPFPPASSPGTLA